MFLILSVSPTSFQKGSGLFIHHLDFGLERLWRRRGQTEDRREEDYDRMGSSTVGVPIGRYITTECLHIKVGCREKVWRLQCGSPDQL